MIGDLRAFYNSNLATTNSICGCIFFTGRGLIVSPEKKERNETNYRRKLMVY